jgi:hypothetical protein
MSKTETLRNYLNGSVNLDALITKCNGYGCSGSVETDIQWNIKISNLDIIDEIHFWGNQLKEHCIFLYLGIEDTKLRTQAYDLYLKWYAFMELRFGDIDRSLSNDILSQRLSNKQLQNIYVTSSQLSTFKPIFGLIDDLRNLKLVILDKLQKQWIGWLGEAFITHILSELEYFHHKLTGTPRVGVNKDDIKSIEESNDEASFWVDVNSDHAAALSQLFDPQYLYDPKTSRSATVTPKSINSTGVYDPNVEDLTFPNVALVEFHSVFENIKHALKATKSGLEMYAPLPSELQSLYAISIRKASDLDLFLTQASKRMAPSPNPGPLSNTGPLKHTIHPLLFNHIKREGLRSIAGLKSLK